MDPGRTLTLSEIVASSLRQALYDGAYTCGERLVELTIAHDLNVSQNTVRDALRILEGEGWLVKQPRYGVYVREFALDEVVELYSLRSALETLALGWAFDRAGIDEICKLRAHVADAHENVQMGNSYAAREALLNFHTDVIRMADKPQTKRILLRLFNQSRLLENLREKHMPRTVGQWRATVNAYETLLKSLEQLDRSAAQGQIHAIIQRDGESLIPVLELAQAETT
jgi:DNA-binding GntR family transcriptional regulator